MAELLTTSGEMDLLHPDGHRVVSGAGTIVATEHRIEVRISVGRPFWFEYASIAEVEPAGDTLPLVLDSGHTVRLSKLEASDRLSRIVVEGRRSEMAVNLRLPNRMLRVNTSGTVEWSEHGWVAQADDASIMVDNTHLTVVPDHHKPFAVPLQWLSAVTRDGATVDVEVEPLALHVRLALGAEGEAAEVEHAARDTREGLRACLTARLGALAESSAVVALASGGLVGEADQGDPQLGGAPRGSWTALLDGLCTEPARAALGFLRGLSRPAQMRLGISALPTREGAVEPVAWALVPTVARGARGLTLAHVLSHEAPATMAFSIADPEAAPMLTLQQACHAFAPDLTPLGMTDIELANSEAGAWLWPVRHLEPLTRARRLFAGQAPTSDRSGWTRDLLALLTGP